MKYIVISGPPGAGKTTLRKTKYASYPFVDIADIYAEKQDISSYNAFNEMLARAYELQKSEPEAIVLEAIINPDSPRQAWLEGYCDQFGITLVWEWLFVKLDVCEERLQAELQSMKTVTAEKMRYFEKRFEIIEGMRRVGQWE